jgi:16S rRNA (uracil1498-N3)-methyltransferase
MPRMSPTRLIVEGIDLTCGELIVPAPAARHARVARVAAGEAVELLDLAGTVGIGRLVAWERDGCRVAVETVVRERGEPPEPLRLALAVLHTAAFDWAVEKATELGVSEIVPVISARTQRERLADRPARWRRVAAAAVAQCGRSRPPAIGEPTALGDAIARAAGLRVVADPAGHGGVLATTGHGVTLLVGPEGGFTDDERARILAAGFLAVPLGRRTLRAETAVVAALAVVQDRLGWR